MTIPESLLDILCCPVSHEPLRPLERSRIKKLNQHVTDGDLLYVDGEAVTDAIGEALITRDGKVVYAVDKGIPVLLPDYPTGEQRRRLEALGFTDFVRTTDGVEIEIAQGLSV
ncbi:MAG: Trm112 family protein, partial [Wenzhouxiangellaceae bacterium]